MEIDTLILILLTSAAIGWYLIIRIGEQRLFAEERAKRELENQKRTQRLKRLMGDKP